jgi:hypothetical protein
LPIMPIELLITSGARPIGGACRDRRVSVGPARGSCVCTRGWTPTPAAVATGRRRCAATGLMLNVRSTNWSRLFVRNDRSGRARRSRSCWRPDLQSCPRRGRQPRSVRPAPCSIGTSTPFRTAARRGGHARDHRRSLRTVASRWRSARSTPRAGHAGTDPCRFALRIGPSGSVGMGVGQPRRACPPDRDHSIRAATTIAW